VEEEEEEVKPKAKRATKKMRAADSEVDLVEAISNRKHGAGDVDAVADRVEAEVEAKKAVRKGKRNAKK
jgi:hypothetical protein